MGKKNTATHGTVAVRKHALRRRTFLIWLGLVSLLFLIFTWENIQATRLGYNVEQTRRVIRSLKITNEYLRYSLESALSPARLRFVAQKRLGMVAPDLSKIVVLGDTASAGPPLTPDRLSRKLRAGLPSASGEGLHASIAFHKFNGKSTPNN